MRELVNAKRFAALFSLSLAIGLFGFIALDSFSESFKKALAGRSLEITGGDLEISSSFPLPEDFLEKLNEQLPPKSAISPVTSLFSMVVARDSTRLIRIVAIEDHYPFYGKLLVEPQPSPLSSSQQVWMDPELATQLNVKLGENIRIGELDFRIGGIIKDDSSRSGSGFDLAPKVYISQKYLPGTKLAQVGSRVRRELLVKLPPNADPDALEETLNAKFNDPNISIESHNNASGQLGRTINYLNDFLGLATLVAIFFAGLGSTYLYRDYLGRKIKDFAILMSCGATIKDIRKILLAKIVVLSFLGVLVAIIIAGAALKFFPIILAGILPKGITLTLQTRSLLIGAATGLATSILFCVPVLSLSKNIKPQLLLQDNLSVGLSFTGKLALGFVPLVFFFYGLSIFLTKSIQVSSIFMISFVASLIILALLGWSILSQFSKVAPRLSHPFKLALTHLRRTPLTTVTSILALGLGVALVNLIPQISSSLKEELTQTSTEKRPDLFMFDIQDEQLPNLNSFLEGQNLRLAHASPMVRARLLKINDEAIEKRQSNRERVETRESERRENFKSRTFNLSSRSELASSERLVKGKPFSGTYSWDSNKPVELSLEMRFADRLGLALGDKMTFDVQGLEVTGEIINLRRVKWTSFHPNFFVVLQPGVLDDAPKTFVAAVALPDPTRKAQLQTSLVKAFSNISIVDVSKAISRVLEISDQMAGALMFMSYLSLTAGLFVLLAIFHHKVSQRKWDLALMKTLGLTTSGAIRNICVEMILLTLITQTIGTGLAITINLVIGYFVFDNIYAVSLQSLLVVNAVVFAISVGMALIVTFRTARIKPAVLLND